jgi:hypothetical protein
MKKKSSGMMMDIWKLIGLRMTAQRMMVSVTEEKGKAMLNKK